MIIYVVDHVKSRIVKVAEGNKNKQTVLSRNDTLYISHNNLRFILILFKNNIILIVR